jgi:hypothetical protein
LPVSVSRRLVRRVSQLRNDAFNAIFAGLLEELRAVALDVIAVTQRAGVGFELTGSEQLGEQRFAFPERNAGEAVTVEIDEIEDLKDKSRNFTLPPRPIDCCSD